MFLENNDHNNSQNFLNNSNATIIDFVHFVAGAHGFGILTRKNYTELPYDKCLTCKNFSCSLAYFDLIL